MQRGFADGVFRTPIRRASVLETSFLPRLDEFSLRRRKTALTKRQIFTGSQVANSCGMIARHSAIETRGLRR
ncbi:hypothetical protein CU100_08615 [Phyllobacterium endophyticum]|uniref:Uncharacterized protein n=1 Tax=Phyllobacterium endophyticum TaxID=1149773 RepID=A0A2P7AU70_9HYPH|nr:hypothetical protein CU100_08615 [Phyllobacterium endophyticum]